MRKKLEDKLFDKVMDISLELENLMVKHYHLKLEVMGFIHGNRHLISSSKQRSFSGNNSNSSGIVPFDRSSNCKKKVIK